MLRAEQDVNRVGFRSKSIHNFANNKYKKGQTDRKKKRTKNDFEITWFQFLSAELNTPHTRLSLFEVRL